MKKTATQTLFTIFTQIWHVRTFYGSQTRVNWLKITGQSLDFKHSALNTCFKTTDILAEWEEVRDPPLNLPFREKILSKDDRKHSFFKFLHPLHGLGFKEWKPSLRRVGRGLCPQPLTPDTVQIKIFPNTKKLCVSWGWTYPYRGRFTGQNVQWL